ncbi:HepT-like ribonuclease domain-containing protein [Uliginosibacterium sediminicola]|uniref:HepT-like ribonuclease domain-containing protein n=1 Tax=Uliginosibacterium sediminicola TaxID=2024550 RepID=A0ABU9YYE8_9RHOO
MYLDDMIAAASELAAIAAEGEAQFKQNLRSRLAAERLIEILGEAATHMPDSVKQRFPALPWRGLSATRNRVIHAYHSLDVDRIWTLAAISAPELLTQLKAVLQAIDSEQ